MGNNTSTDLNNIVVNEEPLLFMRNKKKVCRVLEIQPNNNYKIAFFFKKKLFKMIFKIEDNKNSTYLSSKLMEYFNQNDNKLVYIKFTRFDDNYLWGNMFLTKKDLRNNYSVKDKFNKSNILYTSTNLESNNSPKLYNHMETIPEDDTIETKSFEYIPHSTFYTELEDAVKKYNS